jgi:GntR family transcriptional regulator of gluconate operon
MSHGVKGDTLGPTGVAPEPIEQRALGDQVAASLRYLIARRHYSPGTRLVEGVLADQFAVSRGPIRDAIKTLEAEGLLESRGRGTFVRGFTSADIDELYSLRSAIEQLAITLVSSRSSQVDWSSLDRSLELMEEAAARGDNSAFSRADIAFHSAIYEQSGHRRLWDVWNSFEKTIAVLLEQSGEYGMDIHNAVEDHRNLLRIFKDGDALAGTAAIARHLEGAQARLRGFFDSYESE